VAGQRKETRARRHGKTKLLKDEDQLEAARQSVRRVKKAVGLEEEVNPDDAEWIDIWTRPKRGGVGSDKDGGNRKPVYAGRMLVSIEVLPKTTADTTFPNAFGRKEPNQFPHLPEPAGRMKFSLNPFYMCSECLGPKLCWRLGCCCFCTLFMVLMVLAAPVIRVFSEWLSVLPSPLPGAIGFLLVLAVGLPICWFLAKRRFSRKDEDSDAEDSDEELPLLADEEGDAY
jgi:hypothetical protein